MSKHTNEELKQWQSLPLSIKISMSKQRIRDWINEYGVDGVYISFSGGKDSAVMLDLIRQDYPSVEAVYCDTGLEYPELREYVKSFDNVTWIKPDMNFKKVIEKYGYPIISKEQSKFIYEYRHTKSEHMREYRTTGSHKISKKWMFMTEAPFEISHKCCDVMKKKPMKKFEKQTGKKAFIGNLAQESKLRTQKWLQNGCNAYDVERPISQPLAFWTEQDVLEYIYAKQLPIASVYGNVVLEGEEYEQLSLFEEPQKKFKTTGVERTGCMFCLYGIQYPNNCEKMRMMAESHPNIYSWIMKSTESGGLGYRDILTWINEHGKKVNLKF